MWLWCWKIKISVSKKRIIKLLFVVPLILILSILLIINLSSKPNDIVENWSGSSYRDVSSLTIQGTVYKIETNKRINSEYGYHVFPAVVHVNITHVIWASEQLMNANGIRYLENSTWDRRNTIVIAYDKPESIQLSEGQLIEASGCYCQLSVSAYLNKLVIHSEIQESYIKCT
jgi:hypothetical protein